jgi:hypothetical protein
VALLGIKVDQLQKDLKEENKQLSDELKEENKQLRDELMALARNWAGTSSSSSSNSNDIYGNKSSGEGAEGGGLSSLPVMAQSTTSSSSSVSRGQSGRSSVGGTGSSIQINPFNAKTNPLAKRGSARMSVRLDNMPLPAAAATAAADSTL